MPPAACRQVSELSAEMAILEHRLQQSALSLSQAQDDVRERERALGEMRARANSLQEQLDVSASAMAKERRAHAGHDEKVGSPARVCRVCHFACAH